MEKFLKESGFVKANDIAPFWDKNAVYYMLRINALTWILYNLTDGFITLRRKKESLRQQGKITERQERHDTVDVILPKPYRKISELKKLLESLT